MGFAGSLSKSAQGLLFSLIVIYFVSIALVVFAPDKLSADHEVVLPDGNITLVNSYTKDGRYESVVVANSSIATIIMVMVTARALSWTGDHLVTLTRTVAKGDQRASQPGSSTEMQPLNSSQP
jgi:hypothetical protein